MDFSDIKQMFLYLLRFSIQVSLLNQFLIWIHSSNSQNEPNPDSLYNYTDLSFYFPHCLYIFDILYEFEQSVLSLYS